MIQHLPRIHEQTYYALRCDEQQINHYAESSNEHSRRMYPNGVARSEGVDTGVLEVMRKRLAEATGLYSQTKVAHWSVKGRNLYQLHPVFDQVAKVIERQIEPSAERITQLGASAKGTVRHAVFVSKFPAFQWKPQPVCSMCVPGRMRLAVITEKAQHPKGERRNEEGHLGGAP